MEKKAAWERASLVERCAEEARFGTSQYPSYQSLLEEWNIWPSMATIGGQGAAAGRLALEGTNG